MNVDKGHSDSDGTVGPGAQTQDLGLFVMSDAGFAQTIKSRTPVGGKPDKSLFTSELPTQ
ncbi:hypothetical protein AB4089_17405 [Arthrobacter sp. 2MCAF15]|uniref:hypothetical protein n=1 Tax=Arthrobacter sp. 2MCAF15 TaxID=3232984 RepID=UPI003F901A20